MKASAVSLALGRIFLLGSRPTQPGDVEEYERCRALILDELSPCTPYRVEPVHSWARDQHADLMRGGR